MAFLIIHVKGDSGFKWHIRDLLETKRRTLSKGKFSVVYDRYLLEKFIREGHTKTCKWKSHRPALQL